MARLWILGLALLLCLSPGAPAVVAPDSDAQLVTELVQDFGQNLKKVPLLASEETVREAMHQHYGKYVAPGLLEEWIRCPLKAPGRITSSPWPDSIEVRELKQISDSAFEVEGHIVQKTNAEIVDLMPVTVVVEKVGPAWLITAVLLLPPRQ